MKRIVWLLMMSLVSMFCPFSRAAVYTVNYVRQPSEDSPKRLHAHVAGTGRPAAQLTKATLRTFRVASGESPEIPAGLSVGDELDLDLFSDVRYSVTLIARMKGKSDARMSFLASTDGRDGVCNAVVVWTEAGLQIDVRDYDKRRGYSVFTTADGVIVREIDPSKAGGRHLPSPEIETTGDEQDVETTASVKSLTLSRDVFVDILVAYDIGAAQWAVANGGGLENFAEMAVQRMNKALLNSKIYSSQFSFRLAGTYEVGASAEGDLEGALHAAQAGNRSWRGGDWSGVRLKREKVGADIVVTLIDGAVGRSATAESDTVGIGFALEANSGSFAGLAYSCCAIDCVADDHTMTHEVGHNMGAGHSDVQRLDPGPQYHSYSSGYYLNANGVDCHTIMAYDDDGYSSAEYREIEYFSTPNATYYGVPVGDATHNNALTLMNTCQMVSRFRTAKEAEDPDEPPEEATPEPAGEFFDLAWTTSSDHPWTYGRLANGSFAARSADFRNGTSTPSTGVSWLETTLAGPKVITFSYDTYFYAGPFLVSVDGAVVRSITGGEQWESVEVPEGTHTVRFAFECYDWYCSSDTFNGVWLYDLRVCEKSLVPIIVPDSTSEPETATRFTGELTVLITNSVPDSTIYYSTNHYGDAMLDAQVYTGPLTISKSAVVRAFAKARDGTTSGLTESVFIERHAVQPGEWTADAEGVLAAAKTDGNLIVTVATFSKDGKTSSFGDLVEVAESPAFCTWARENKVFLLACDMTQSQGGYHRGEGARCDIGWGRYVEYLSAYRYFGSLASNTDLTTTRLVVSRAWDPSRCVGEMAGRSGSYLGGAQYQGTVDSLIACLGSILAPRPSKSVTVTFEAGEGTVSPKTLTRQSGQPFGTLPVPTRKNYVFMGWKCKVPSSDEDGYAFYHYFVGAAVLPEDIVPYEDVTLVAQWEDRRVYVYFMRQYTPNGAYYWQYGNYYQRGCAYGELPEDDPTMTGYAFLGWYSEKKWGERIDETSIVPDQTTPVTNYAHWIANEYKVRYNANDTDEFPAEGEMRVQTFRYDLAEELRPNAFVREGYDFQGWTTHPDWTYVYYKDAQLISNLTSKADETVDLYAAWKARQVTITFDMNDFPNFQDTEKQLTVGSPFSWQIPSVYSTRYVVDGFYTARKGGVELLATTSVPARDTTYYLQWHKKHYSVAFNANGGSGAMAPQDFVYGESQRLSENAFAKAGSLFSGWATSPDGEVRYADRQRVTDLEATEGGTFQLYAKWEPTENPGSDEPPPPDGGTYMVTFDLGEHGTRTGGGELTQEVAEGGDAVAPTFAVTDGWEFTGWDKPFANVTADLTVTAQYKGISQEQLKVYEDIDEAKAVAVREGKLVFLLSGATWCPYTRKLQQYLTDAGSVFADNYVYLWHDQDKDPFGIAEMSSIPEFWIFQPSDLDLSTKSSWSAIALFNCPGCPTDYEYFLRVLESVAESKPAKAMPLSLAGTGWHEVSFSVLPEGGKPEDVFAPVEDTIGYVTYGSQNWNPLTGGTLTALEIGKGYWVQTTADKVTWTVTGQPNPDVEIALKAGWNLIGYPLLEEGEIETVLAAALATGNIRYIYSGSRVYPGTLTTMTPGKGYWVYAEAAATIRFVSP